MTDPGEFLRCPKCHADNWVDQPHDQYPGRTRFRCFRCSHTFQFVVCGKCKARSWKMEAGIEAKGGHRPFYRFRCGNCGRTVGVKIHSP